MERPIGRTIAEARLARGLTQEALAGLAGVATRTVSGVESGQAGLGMSLETLVRLADALRLNAGDLLNGAVGVTEGGTAASARQRRMLRREAVIRERVERLSTRWGTVVGRIWFPWVVASYGPYASEHIQSYFTPQEPTYPDAVEESFRAVREDIAAREARGEEVPYDSDDFKLTAFHVSSRVGSTEEPRLVLHFAPTTYYRMLATDQRLDVPVTVGGRTYTLRERYAADVDLRVAPVPELATHWGVGLSVITAEGLMLVSERGNTAVDPFIYFPAVAEGANRPMDSAPNGAPDHFSIARRGVQEELGVELAEDELTWLSFGANSYLCEYGLIGRVDTRFTLADIESRRSLGAAKDSWETRQLHPVEFDPESVATFCSEPHRRFSAFALVTVIHTLLNEFGVTRTERAFANAHVAVTQHLPRWLEELEDLTV